MDSGPGRPRYHRLGESDIVSYSQQRDLTGLGIPLALVREASALTLAVLVLLATFRLSRSPLLALPIAGLVYWGVRSWIHRVAAGGSSRTGRHVARLQEMASNLKRQTTAARKPTEPSLAGAASRIRALAKELQRLDRELESHPDLAVDAEFFVSVQLPQAIDLVERYAELVKTPEPDDRTLKELRATEATFDLLLSAIREQSRRFAKHDLHEFAIDRRAFEELLRLDGVASDAQSATNAQSATDYRHETA